MTTQNRILMCDHGICKNYNEEYHCHNFTTHLMDLESDSKCNCTQYTGQFYNRVEYFHGNTCPTLNYEWFLSCQQVCQCIIQNQGDQKWPLAFSQFHLVSFVNMTKNASTCQEQSEEVILATLTSSEIKSTKFTAHSKITFYPNIDFSTVPMNFVLKSKTNNVTEHATMPISRLGVVELLFSVKKTSLWPNVATRLFITPS